MQSDKCSFFRLSHGPIGLGKKRPVLSSSWWWKIPQKVVWIFNRIKHDTDHSLERIMQIGKKKLVLDHLIVQKINDDEDNGGEDVQSILTYGAQALFESEGSSRDITCEFLFILRLFRWLSGTYFADTDNDIDKLLEKTEREAVKEAPKASGGLTFAFAKVWAAEKDVLEDIGEEDQTDSWAQTLEKINQNRAKEQEKEATLSGRGARRRAADIAKVFTSMNDICKQSVDWTLHPIEQNPRRCRRFRIIQWQVETEPWRLRRRLSLLWLRSSIRDR